MPDVHRGSEHMAPCCWRRRQHPAWTSNLLAYPEATTATGGAEIAVRAEPLRGPDREQARERFLAYPMYRSYRGRTDREPRLFALSRA